MGPRNTAAQIDDSAHFQPSSSDKSLISEVSFYADALVPVTFGDGQPILALIDTGASSNLMSARFAHTIRKHCMLLPSEKKFFSATGETVDAIAQADASFHIGDRAFSDEFEVCPSLTNAVILGREFLYNNGAAIDFSNNQLKFQAQTQVVAANTTIIPPNKSVVITAKCARQCDLPTGLHGATEERRKRNGLTIHPTACTTQHNRIPIVVSNRADWPIRLKAGTYLTEFLPLREGECPTNGRTEWPTINTVKDTDEPVQSQAGDKDRCQWIKQECPVPLDKVPITASQMEDLKGILYDCRGAFVDATGKLGYNDWVPHRINMKPGTAPITKQPYRMPPDVKEALEQQIAGLVKQGVLIEDDTPWCSPVVPIKKGMSKTRKHLQSANVKPEIRLTVDFRYVNAHSLPNQAPINNIQDVIDGIGASNPRFFSSLDMKHGYFQQALHPDSVQYTGFMFNRRTFTFRTCPQGLNSSPFLFQKLMNKVLDDPMKGGQVFCYLDDILVVSPNWKEHCQALRATLGALEKANLKLSGAKCSFAQNSVEFLGFTLTHDGVTPAAKHVEALKTYPVPRTAQQVKTFLGLVNFFRSWIPQRGEILRPLQKLIRREAKFIWTKECQTAFERIRDILTTKPVLAYPDFDSPFVVATDASTTAIGAVLCQPYGPEDKLRPVAFLGRATSPQETKWSITELEGLAVVYAVKHWDVYLSSRRFLLYTDHAALTSILTGTKQLSPKLARYALFLSNYEFDMEHCKGKLNSAADAMSRRLYNFDWTETDEGLNEWPYDLTLRSKVKDEPISPRKEADHGKSKVKKETNGQVNAVTRSQAKRKNRELHCDAEQISSSKRSKPKAPPRRSSLPNREKVVPAPLQVRQSQTSPGDESSLMLSPRTDNDREMPTDASRENEGHTFNPSVPEGKRNNDKNSSDTRSVPMEGPSEATLDKSPLRVVTKRQLRNHQLAEAFCSDMIQFLETGRLPLDLARKHKCISRRNDHAIQDGILYQKWIPVPELKQTKLRLVVPKTLQASIIKEVHTGVLSSHLGIEKTVGLLKQRCTFKGMHERVRRYIASCEVCHKVKAATKKVVRGGSLYEMTEEPFMRVHVDFAGPLPVTRRGNRFFCVATDSCSGYTVSWPCRTLTAESFARNFYEKFVCIYGAPIKLCSDNASTFRSTLWAEVAQLLQMNMTFVAPYTPRSNGRAESAVKATMRVIRCMALDHGPRWDDHLPAATYALNNSLHAGHNLSPYNIVFGRCGRIPVDTELMAETPERPFFQIVEDIREHQRVAIETAIKLQAERDRRVLSRRPEEKNIEDLVAGSVVFWKKPQVKAEGEGKLAVPNHGPYVIIKRYPDTARLRHLHTGEFVKYGVNVEQLRIAKDFQQSPTDMQNALGHPVWTSYRRYRAHANEPN